MNTCRHIAKHLREVYFGDNWTDSNLKDNLAGITWQQANARVHSFNTIVALVYHMGYYVSAITRVLQDKPIDSNDKQSFEHPPVQNEADWQAMQDRLWTQVETCAALIEQLPESKLWETFVDERYGVYYRNLHGLIEHTHYHLGQIALIKKILPPA